MTVGYQTSCSTVMFLWTSLTCSL